jgi:hypothetical protein
MIIDAKSLVFLLMSGAVFFRTGSTFSHTGIQEKDVQEYATPLKEYLLILQQS